MADLGGVFDADSVKPMGDRSPVPPGDYRVVCVKSDFKPTSTGGMMLEFTWQVLEGPHARRMVWSKLNLRNVKPDVVARANEELSAICHAVGVSKLKDSIQAHDIPIIVSLAIEPPNNGYPAKNKITAYKSLKDASEVRQAVPVGASVSGESKPAWM
jgi:hypothetical protein